MLKYMRIISVLLIILSISFSGFSQISKLQIKGDKFLKKQNYIEAIAYFNSLDSSSRAQDPYYDYYLGMSYYYSVNQKEKSIDHFENYIDNNDIYKIGYRGHGHVYYILGKMYHLTYNFIEAKEKYLEYIEFVKNSSNIPRGEKKETIKSVLREIEQCKYGEISLKNPRNVIIENLGDSINTIYPEYASVVSQDEKVLVFTSRRPDTKGGKTTPGEGFYEDVYKADLLKGSLFEERVMHPDSLKSFYFSLVTDFEYENFQNMGDQINTKGHDAGIQFGQGDSVLYFYRDSDIWSINLYDSVNFKAKKMGVEINTNQHEPSLFFAYNGLKLFIVSDRPGGYGGLDLYMSEMQADHTWSEAVNLGPNINTKYDEDAPYFDPNGKTLYFSSTGHSSTGGYDVFRSKVVKKGWSDPVNMGFPINTTSDDIYFTMTSRYNRGYYSSGKLEGKGDMDLYRITFSDERDPVAELTGFVKRGKDLVPAKSIITMVSVDKSEEISNASDSITGDYFLLLGHGKEYDMRVETEGFAPYTRRFEIPEQKEYFQLYQEVHHVHLFDSKGNIIGQKITVFNAFGGADSTVTLYDDQTTANLEKMKISIDYEGNINKLSDVKFYISEDSLRTLMELDTSLSFAFDAYTNIAFTDGGDKLDEERYKQFKASLKREVFLKNINKLPNENSILVNEATEKDESSFSFTETTVIEKRNDLFYSVQIGVYENLKTPEIIFKIDPLNIEFNELGQKRYTTGQFSTIREAENRRKAVVKGGILDAYVTAYYEGKRITITEAKAIKSEKVPVSPAKDTNK